MVQGRGRSFLSALLVVCAVPAAVAQDYPSRPVRIIMPNPTASGPDIVIRALAESMSRTLGQNVIVDAKAGGGGVPAVLDLKGAPADGYTIFAPDSSHWAVFPALRSDLPYDPVKDFTGIGMVYSNDLYFSVLAESPIKSLSDIVARARANPGSLRFGVTGVGSIMYIVGEAFKTSTGTDMAAVPFRGSAESLAGMMRGDLDFILSGYGTITNHVKAGKIRALANSSPRRDRYTPDVPSVMEAAGLREFNFPAEIALVARAGTPRPVIDRLFAALEIGQKDPAVVTILANFLYTVRHATPDEFTAKMRSDLEKYRAVVKAANLKVQ
jgi:tripartite-type tricarboxylate transporter receptor subunit TctC